MSASNAPILQPSATSNWGYALHTIEMGRRIRMPGASEQRATENEFSKMMKRKERDTEIPYTIFNH